MKLEILNLLGNQEVEVSTMKLIAQFLIQKTDAILTLQKLYIRRFLNTTHSLDEVIREIQTLLEARVNKYLKEDEEEKARTRAASSVAGEKEGVLPVRKEKERNEKERN